jgi:protein O-mannosyl-transferase
MQQAAREAAHRNPSESGDRQATAPASLRDRLLRPGLVLLLVALVFLAYHAAPNNGFHLDDADNIVRHGAVHMSEFGLDALLRAATDGFLPRRVLPNLTFAFDWWRGGGQPSAFQLTNVAIHALSAVAVLALLQLALARHGVGARDSWIAATLAAAAWAIHPIQVQAVTYIVQRMASMAALFMLIAVWSYVRGRTERSWRWYAAAGAAAIAALLSKENACVLPALLLLAEYTLCRDADRRLRGRLDFVLLSIPLFIALYAVVDLVFHGPLWAYVEPGYATRDFTLAERLLTQPRVIAFHLGQVLWPLPGRFSIEHDFVLSTSLWQPWTTPLALGGLAAWVFGGIWLALRGPAPVAGFLMLWVPATLLVESSAIPLEMVFEHRMYLPSVGLAGLFALALARLLQSAPRRRVIVASAVLLGGLLAATLVRVPVWRTPLSLYENAVPHAAGSARTWTNLGTHYEAAERSADAIAAYSKAIALKPDHAIAYLNRGSSHAKSGRYADAEADYRHFVALAPADFRGAFALGSLYLGAERYAEAADWLTKAATQATTSPLPLLRLAELHLATGRPAAALDALIGARTRDAAIMDGQFYEQFGVAQAQLGRFDAAIEAFDRSLREDPARVDTLLNRAFALLRVGMPQRALADFDRALALRPVDAHALYGRAETLASLGQPQQALAAARAALAIDPDHPRARRLIDELDRPRTE